MKSPPHVRTRSLLLRPPGPDDVDPLYAIQGDREAMRYTWWAPSRQAVADRLAAHAARHAVDGFSPWTACLHDGGAVVGWGGLCVDPDDPVWGAEVVYLVHPRHWGRGLASEIVEAALEHAFGRLGLPRVTAFARPENGASRRVLEKHDFRLLGHVTRLERNRYTVEQEDWKGCRD